MGLCPSKCIIVENILNWDSCNPSDGPDCLTWQPSTLRAYLLTQKINRHQLVWFLLNDCCSCFSLKLKRFKESDRKLGTICICAYIYRERTCCFFCFSGEPWLEEVENVFLPCNFLMMILLVYFFFFTLMENLTLRDFMRKRGLF